MALTKAEIAEVKKQLHSQVQHLSPEKKADAIKQIEDMSEESLEALVQQQRSRSSQPVFRMIIEKRIPSVQIDENSDCVAVLDIMPISRGHTLIIPKSPAKTEREIPESAKKLASSVSKKIMDNLKAKSVQVISESKFNEFILNVLPIYDHALNLESQRTESSPEKLEEIKKEILKEVIKVEKKVEKIKITKPKVTKKSILKLNKRIP